MIQRRRSAKLLASVFALSLIAAACGDDDEGTSPETTEEGGGESTETTAPAGDAAMTVTYDINPDAVWQDGAPITAEDFTCTWQANLNTPGSLSTTGWDKIIDVVEGESEKQVVVTFSEVYAPYKNLFNQVLQTASVADCNDVSADFIDSMPLSGRAWLQESWSPDQQVLVPNPNYWGDPPAAERVVMVPKADSDTEVASLLSGESDFIFPQAFSGLAEALDGDPNIEYVPGYGTQYEGLYFNQSTGPFADDDFRAAFSMSIDRNLILSNIYEPIFPGAELLNCGLWVPTIGDWCDQSVFGETFDPEGAATLLEGAGWTRNAEGLWEKDGTVPEIRWIVNTGNSRRESTQALLIPELREAGFNVRADNCDAACYFQTRLPALDYDLAMYINVAQPDPTVTNIMGCAQIPSEENGNQGQNTVGWCNEEADALMLESDQNLDEASRIEQIHQIAAFLAEDHVMLPLYQFPNIAAWRTDRLSGPIGDEAANYTAFAANLDEWEAEDGEIIIGAEQWPECLNPVTECANSSWMVWTASFPLLPAAFDTTADGDYEVTDLLAGEPTVETAE